MIEREYVITVVTKVTYRGNVLNPRRREPMETQDQEGDSVGVLIMPPLMEVLQEFVEDAKREVTWPGIVQKKFLTRMEK